MGRLDWSNHHEGHEKIADWAMNAFGQKELVYIPRMWWRFLEWMKKQYDYDIDNFTSLCDSMRGELTFGKALDDWCYYLARDRYAANLDLPDWLVPEFLE